MKPDGARPVQVLHEKGGRRLVRIEFRDGTGPTVRYGVEDGSKLVFLGTKAEAKKVYGTWRSDAR